MLGLRQLGDVIASVLQRDELATAWQRYRIVKMESPRAGRSARQQIHNFVLKITDTVRTRQNRYLL